MRFSQFSSNFLKFKWMFIYNINCLLHTCMQNLNLTTATLTHILCNPYKYKFFNFCQIRVFLLQNDAWILYHIHHLLLWVVTFLYELHVHVCLITCNQLDKTIEFWYSRNNTILQPPTFSCCSLIKLNRYSKLLGVTPLKSCWKFSTSSDGPTVWMYDYRLMYTQTRSVTEMLIW